MCLWHIQRWSNLSSPDWVIFDEKGDACQRSLAREIVNCQRSMVNCQWRVNH